MDSFSLFNKTSIIYIFTMFTVICFNISSQRKLRKMYKKNPPDLETYHIIERMSGSGKITRIWSNRDPYPVKLQRYSLIVTRTRHYYCDLG